MKDALKKGPDTKDARAQLQDREEAWEPIGTADQPISLTLMGLMSGSAISVTMILAYLLVGFLKGSAEASTTVLVSIIVAGLAGGFLQQLCFNFRTDAGPGYPARVAGFGLSYFVVLSACAYLGAWLPTDNPWAWASFAVLYLIILAVLTALISWSIRRKTAAYQQLLDEYRAKRE